MNSTRTDTLSHYCYLIMASCCPEGSPGLQEQGVVTGIAPEKVILGGKVSPWLLRVLFWRSLYYTL